MDAHARQLELYPIGTIAALCGVDTATLRNWELRYGLLQPHRDQDGRRYYSEADLDRIRRIIALLDDGLAIHDVAPALDGTRSRASLRSDTRDAWEHTRCKIRDAIARFDERTLFSAYLDALATYPVRCVLQHALLPVLQQLSERADGESGVLAEQKFFIFFLRNNLGARFHHRRQTNYGPKLLATCMPGEQHDIGLLMFALCAHERGYRVTVLGKDVPLSEAAHAAKRANVHAIVLSTSLEPDAAVWNESLPVFLRSVTMPVFIGGLVSAHQRGRYESLGALVLRSQDADESLEQIRATLARRA